MKIGRKNIILALLLIGAIAMLAPQTAMAVGTAAGTTIINNFTVDYSVNSTAQPQKTGSTNFKVDDKVNFTLTAQDSANVTISPSGAAYQTYVLANTGNGPHDFTISPVVIGGNTLAPATGPTLYSTNTGTGGTQLPTDGTTSLQYVSLASDATTTVYMYITAPAAPTDGNSADYNVTAVAYQAGNLGLPSPVLSSTQATADASVDKNANLNNQYVVLADGQGTGTGDGLRDGKFAAIAKTGGNVTVGFLVQSANITVGKTSALYSDPIGGVYNALTNKAPKAIPGAYMIYTLTVTNSGSAPTSSLSISDTLPLSLSFITYNDGTNTCAGGQVVINGGCSAAGVTIGGQTLTVTGLSAAASGGTAIVKYMVQIN